MVAQNDIKRLQASKQCLCMFAEWCRMYSNKVQSCIIMRCTHMFGWIIIFPLKPRPESSRRNKQTHKQEKKLNYTLLAKTRESVRLCASLLFRWASRCWDDEWFIILEDSNSVSVSRRSALRSDVMCEIRPISSRCPLSNVKARIIKQITVCDSCHFIINLTWEN